MISNIIQHWKKILLFLVSFLILFFSFQYNTFNSAQQRWFKNFQNDSESLVTGRLVKSREDGIFSAEAKLGRYWGGKFNTYSSQLGFQGIFFSVVDDFLERYDLVKLEDRIDFFHGISSMLMALILTVIVLLFYFEIGFFPALFLLLSIAMSQWLIVMGKNLYWFFGVMYLPFVAVFIAHKYEEINHKLKVAILYASVYFFTLIKSLNGYEYISTVLIAMLSPIVYFSIKNRWNKIKTIKRIFYTGLFGFLGFISALLLHIMQLYTATHSITKAWDMILARILVRTYGSVSENSVYYKSLTASVFEVYHKYFNGIAIEFQNFIDFRFFHSVRYEDLLWLFLLATVFSFTYFKSIKDNHRKLLALSFATWFSFLAPMSWYTLAKGHSYIHTHINYVLWHLPFTLFGFALVGFVAYLLLTQLYKKYRYIFLVLIFGILISIITTTVLQIKESNSKIENLLNTKKVLDISSGENVHIILTESNRLIYYIQDCNSKDTANRFFLHLYPEANKNLKRKKYSFNNYDFKWSQFDINIPKFSSYSGSCIAVRQLPTYSLRSINTGRYSGSTRFWQKKIEVQKLVKKTKLINPYNLSDGSWKNGISKTKAGFFIKNNFRNRVSLKVDSILKFSFSGERKILKITTSNQYINIDINGTLLDPVKDGYPNKINIKDENNNGNN
ncbi:MAG: hypothetical protein JJV95_00965 [Sulfurospirillum sp.]|nr:hypothetical protein [Sulfurospirillum sp.]